MASSGSPKINAYLQRLVRDHLEALKDVVGADAAFARDCGVTAPAISNLKNHGMGGGVRMLEAVAKGLKRPPWELYREALGGGQGGSIVSGAAPLRDLPTWSSVAERARGLVDELDAPLVDEVGGFVPPAPIDRVTVALVTALVTGWKSVRPVAAELPTVARQKTFASPAVGEARSAVEKSGKGRRKKLGQLAWWLATKEAKVRGCTPRPWLSRAKRPRASWAPKSACSRPGRRHACSARARVPSTRSTTLSACAH